MAESAESSANIPAASAPTASTEPLPPRNNRRVRGVGGGDQRTTTGASAENSGDKEQAPLPPSITEAEAAKAPSLPPPSKQRRNAKAAAPSTSGTEPPPLPPPFSPLKTPSSRGGGGRGNAVASAEGEKAPLSATAVAEKIRAEAEANKALASSGANSKSEATSSSVAASGDQARQRGGAARGGRGDKADSGVKNVEESIGGSGRGRSEREKKPVSDPSPAAQSSAQGRDRRQPPASSGASVPPIPPIPTAHSATALKASSAAVSVPVSASTNAPLDATRNGRQGGGARSKPQAAGAVASNSNGGSSHLSTLPSASSGSLVPSQVRGSAAASNPPPPRFLPVEASGQFVASGPSRQSDNTFADYVPIEQKISQVANSKEFQAYFEEQCKKNNLQSIKVSKTSGGLPRIEIKGSDSSAVRRARVLIETYIQHKATLMTLKQKEEGLEQELQEYNKEIDQGLRCEFEVPASVLGIIIGKQGANVQRVQADTGVERIVIESDTPPHLVRIKGATAASVSAARLQLEYTVRRIPAIESEISFLTNQDSKRLSAVKAKSRVISIEPVFLSDNKQALEIIGLVSDVEIAEVLIQADLDFNREAKKTASTISQLESRVAEMHIGYGERRNANNTGGGGDEARESRQKSAPRPGGGGDRDRRGFNNTSRSNAGSGDSRRPTPGSGGTSTVTRKL